MPCDFTKMYYLTHVLGVDLSAADSWEDEGVAAAREGVLFPLEGTIIDMIYVLCGFTVVSIVLICFISLRGKSKRTCVCVCRTAHLTCI